MNDRWERVTSLFDAARLLDPAARSAFLELACAADTALRTEIEALLASEAAAGDFLAEPIAPELEASLRASRVLLETGQMLKNRYRVHEVFSVGGQALVYKATDELLCRPVVVKVLRAEGRCNSVMRVRLHEEMQALARIDHPGVVGILDTGELEDGSPFLAIQYIEGVSLREAFKAGRLESARIAAILRQIGAALEATHAVGIAHRDLKPENVMLQRLADGSEAVKLIDFGIAKIERSELKPEITMVMVAGTVRYMAPEQFEGMNSLESDIYSLGLVACEMLCGQPDIRALPDSISRGTRRKLEAALAFRPKDRPKNVRQWADDLAASISESRRYGRLAVIAAGACAILISSGWLSVRSVSNGDESRIIEKVGAFDPLIERLKIHGWSLWRSFDDPAPLLHGSGWVLVANFENRTGESLFEGTIEYALERELSNSQFVKVVPHQRVEDALRLIKKPLDSRVDVKLGREICLRDGEIQALIMGRVEKLGTMYVLSAEIINPANGVQIASLSEEDRADKLTAAIRRLSSRVRRAVGEDHRLIQQSNERLEEVTTPSLRALQLYTQADRVVARAREGDFQAVELLEQALKEDPNFASAHNLLGHAYANLGQNDKALPHFQRAFELADSTPDREKFFILGSYYSRAVNQPEKAAAAYEALLRLYPDHYWGNINLAAYYLTRGRRHDAAEHFVRMANLRPNDRHANASAVVWLTYQAMWETAAPDTKRRDILNRAETYNARAHKLLEIDDGIPSRGDADILRMALVQQDWLAGDLSKAYADLRWLIRENKTLQADVPVGLLLGLGKLHDAEREAAGNVDLLSAIAFYRGDLSKAKELLRSKQSDDPSSWSFSLNACLMIRLRMFPEAERIRRMGLVFRKPSVPLIEGQLALARGETPKGITLLERALHADEASSTTVLGYEALGDTYRKLGRRDDAVRVLEEESGVHAIGNLAEAFRMRVRLQLADLYRELDRISDAERVESELRRELKLADADHPILLALARRAPPALLKSQSTR